jgi:hypothetical protein
MHGPSSQCYFGLAAFMLGALPAMAQHPSAEEMNAANNPLQPTIGFNLQNQYTGRYYGLGDEDGNAFLMRGTVPHRTFGMPQLMRLTLPVATTPDVPPVGGKTGLGDLNLFNVFLAKSRGVEYGLGPQMTIPTATRDATGTGKWQAGLAGVVMAPQKWGLAGGLVTWQHSFAGQSDRPTQDNLQAQPFLIYNLPKGWYLRSSATWNWDIKRDTYYAPIGAGLGKVFKSGGATYNFFAEPQWTVMHSGDAVPKFQLFFGLNMQFPE